MRVLFRQSALGSESEFCLDTETNRLTRRSDENSFDWEFSNSLALGTLTQYASADELFALNRVEIKPEIPEKYSKAFATVKFIGKTYVERAMPKKEFDLFANTAAMRISEELAVNDSRYYREIFRKSSEAFMLLAPTKIKAGMEDIARQHGAIFITEDLIEPPRYERITSKSGRMKTTSGTSVLTMSAKDRSMFESVAVRGKIMYIDYASFEAQIALAMTGMRLDGSDVYERIRRELLIPADRKTVKNVVISSLYGGGSALIANMLKTNRKNATDIVKDINVFFAAQDKKEELETAAKHSQMTNFYGRRLFTDGTETPAKLYNLFVQSTAADAAMLGLRKFAIAITEHGIGRPLFFLHDAMVFDCIEFNENKFDDALSAAENIQGFNGKFGVTVKDFTHTTC